MNLRDKTMDVAGETLKKAAGNEKLSSHAESSAKLSRTIKGEAESLITKSVDHSLSRKRSRQLLSNREVASDALLHRTKPEERLGVLNLSESDPNAKKLHDNGKKLQKKLQQQYHIKTSVEGGLKTDLRIEQTVESKLSDVGKYSGIDAAASFGQRVLHFADDLADDKDGLGIQNAWTDSASKVTDTGIRVYRLSKQAKYYRASKKEKEIAKLIRQEDKIAINNIKFQYGSQLQMAKESELWKHSNLYERHLQKKAIKKKYMKNAIKEYQQAKKTGASAKVTYTTGLNFYDKIKQGVTSLVEMVKALLASKIGKIAIVVMLVIAVLTGLISIGGTIILMSFGGSQSQTQIGTGFPPEVLQWKDFVVERCEANNDSASGVDLTLFVNAILTTIQQESGGVSESCGGDLMQCAACGLWDDAAMPSEWTTEQKSIDVGIRYFYSGLKSFPVTDPEDYDGLQMVAQGYNYGFAFLTWARDTKHVTTWSLELSSEYSDMRAAAAGWSSYGHKPYGQEWIDKYRAGSSVGSGEVVEQAGPGGVMATAQNQIGICEDPPGSNDVVFNTDYYGYEVSGDDYPWCCVFVWWCFNKSGNGAAFYNGGKVAGCSAVYTWAQQDGLFITKNQAQFGDIVLFGTDHIELVVSVNPDGSVTTIGGNTSSDEAGSQSNGGCVALKTRYTSGSFPITSFIHPEY